MCAGTAAVERRMSGARAAVVLDNTTAAAKARTSLGFGIRDWGFARPAARCPNPKSRIRPTNPKSRIPNPESVSGRLADGLQDVRVDPDLLAGVEDKAPVRSADENYYEARAYNYGKFAVLALP